MPQIEQGLEIRTKIRSALYRQLYDREYRSGASSSSAAPDDFAQGPSTAVKPYIPPTDPEQLMRVLDAPLGG